MPYMVIPEAPSLKKWFQSQNYLDMVKMDISFEGAYGTDAYSLVLGATSDVDWFISETNNPD